MIKVGIAGFGKIGQLRAEILSKRDDVGIEDILSLNENICSNIRNPKSSHASGIGIH